MRKLGSGIFGIVFGLAVMCGGGAASGGSGAYRAGATGGLICGGIFFIVGIPYLILGIMEMVNDAKERRPRGGKKRKRPKDRAVLPTASKNEIAAKAAATKELLRRLGAEDDWFEPKHLKEVVGEVFGLFQEGWENGDFGCLGKHVVHDCIDKYLDRYENEARRLKMPKLDDVELSRIQFVYVSALGEPDKHTFTAYLEGSGPDNFKEYWTFCRTAKRWKLDRMQGVNVSEAVMKLNDVPPEMIAGLEAEENTEEILKYVFKE